MTPRTSRFHAATAFACFLLGSTDLSAADQIRLSLSSGIGNTEGFATGASTAYDPNLNQVLVVWWGEDDSLPGGTARNSISGRLTDANSALPNSQVVRIDTNAAGINSLTPHVAYNTIEREYLVVWANETTATHYEIFVQRLEASNLQPLLAQPQQVSAMGGLADVNFSALEPSVAFNPDRNEYLVAWVGSDSRVGMTELQRDVFIQRLDGRDGSEIGADDLRISTASSADETRRVAASSGIDVAYSSNNGNYLVVWSADDAGHGLADEEYEIFGQLIDGATGVETGADDTRLSVVGPAGNAFFDAEQPSVIAEDNNFIVAYRADAVQGFKEIHATKANGVVGTSFGGQNRLTFTTGGDARWPDVALNEGNGQVIVAFQAREVVGSNPVFESEVFVQRVTPFLQPIGDEQRVSKLGPDGSASYGPDPGLSNVSLGARGNYFVAWSGDHDRNGQLDGEGEVFARSSVVPPFFRGDFEDR